MRTIAVAVLLLLVATFSFAGELTPKYDKEKGYGWVEVNRSVNTDYPNAILKEWRIYNSREIFVDKGKDGTCDLVYIFRATGNFDEQGRELYMMDGVMSCEEAEEQIKNFLEYQNSQ